MGASAGPSMEIAKSISVAGRASTVPDSFSWRRPRASHVDESTAAGFWNRTSKPVDVPDYQGG